MATGDPSEGTKVSDRGTVAIPARVRQRLDIEAGDTLQWGVTEEGDLHVEVVQQRYGVFAGDDLQADLGGDSVDSHDHAGGEHR